MPIYKVAFPANLEIFLIELRKVVEFDFIEKDKVIEATNLDVALQKSVYQGTN